MAMTKTARFGLIAGLVPLAMLGAAYAAVPLYQLFCQVTGYGGTTQVATEAASQVLTRTIQVRFDANVAPGVPWSFKPEKPVVSLKLGENGLAFYTVKMSPTDPSQRWRLTMSHHTRSGLIFRSWSAFASKIARCNRAKAWNCR